MRLVVLGFAAMQVPSFFTREEPAGTSEECQNVNVCVNFLNTSVARFWQRFPPNSAPFFHRSRPDLCPLTGAEVPFRLCFAPGPLVHSLTSKSHPRKQVRAVAHFQA